MPSNNSQSNWRERAACNDDEVSLDWFFPLPKKVPLDPERPEETHSPEQAKAVCRRCDVQGYCLEEGMRNNEDGVWGGMTKRERRALKKRRRTAIQREG